MKQIKNLTADFRDLRTQYKDIIKAYRRLRAFEKWIEYNIPNDIRGTYSFSHDLGCSTPRVFITLSKDDVDTTISLIKWLSKLKKQRFEIEKFWRKEHGYFAYRAERKYKDYINYIILIENTANIDGCVIKEETVLQKVYTTDCERERVML